jgi:hypothetical protein
MAETQAETTGREFLDYMATSMSRERNPPEVLVGFLILGSFFMCFTTYSIAACWMIFSLDLRKKLTLTAQIAAWLVFVLWGCLSSALVSAIVGYMLVMTLSSARSGGDGGSDEQREELDVGYMTPQYVTFLGMSLGTMILYRNCGRGWSPVFRRG